MDSIEQRFHRVSRGLDQVRRGIALRVVSRFMLILPAPLGIIVTNILGVMGAGLESIGMLRCLSAPLRAWALTLLPFSVLFVLAEIAAAVLPLFASVSPEIAIGFQFLCLGLANIVFLVFLGRLAFQAGASRLSLGSWILVIAWIAAVALSVFALESTVPPLAQGKLLRNDGDLFLLSAITIFVLQVLQIILIAKVRAVCSPREALDR